MNGSERISRRSFLRLAGAGAAMTALAACAPAAAPAAAPSSAPAADAPAADAPTAAADAGKLEVFSWWTAG
ncbi:MAG: twin-arginine translocation signal domain-containing protein, partial [Caldilineaceae bacterium]